MDLSGNRIGDIRAIAGLTKLTDLALVDIQLTDIGPLSRLTKLHWLDLSVNQIRNINVLVILNNLTFLYLYSNQITDLLVIVVNRAIGFQDQVNVERNPIDCTNYRIKDQLAILENREVLLKSPCY